MNQEQALAWIVNLIEMRKKAFGRWPTQATIHADIFDAAFPEVAGSPGATHDITVQGHVVMCIRA